MNKRVQAYLRLTRPPNLVTAISDIWAGAALAGLLVLNYNALESLVLLSLSSMFLYAGGVVLNDVCDAKLDAVERPERPIPSGIISSKSALILTWVLFILGIILAEAVSEWSGLLALLIALACIVYDGWAKPHIFWGPFIMGLCRGLNLLLGMSILSFSFAGTVWIAIIPLIYIAAVTLISRGEVQGGSRSSVWTAFLFYVIVIGAIVGIALTTRHIWTTLAFLLLFILFIFPPLLKAIKTLSGKHIGKAVKGGVLGLILMNACWVAASGNWIWAIITALLLPLSMWIAKWFAVT